MRGRLVAVVVVVAAVGLSGCIGDEDDGAAATPSTSIQVETSEFSFDPDAWTVPAGQEVTVEVDNGGTIGHEWVVIQQGQDLASEADYAPDKELFKVDVVNPGTSTSQTFTVDEPGTYQVICSVAGHFDAGMEGRLTVQ